MAPERDSPDEPQDDHPTWVEGALEFRREVPYLLSLPPETTAPAPLVVALHGMGMSARSFARRLEPGLGRSMAILAPQGPYPFEIRDSGRMKIGHAWYQYRGDEEEWLDWMLLTERYLLTLIEKVAASPGVDSRRIALLGYSQGCYLGYFVALRSASRFRGYVAIGGRLKRRFLERELAAGPDLPVLVVHGKDDPSVPLAMADASEAVLRESGLPVDRVTTDSAHAIVPEQVRAAADWLSDRLA